MFPNRECTLICAEMGGVIIRPYMGTINLHSPGGVAEREKKDGISIPIKKRVMCLFTLSLQKYHVMFVFVAMQQPVNELTKKIDC